MVNLVNLEDWIFVVVTRSTLKIIAFAATRCKPRKPTRLKYKIGSLEGGMVNLLGGWHAQFVGLVNLLGGWHGQFSSSSSNIYLILLVPCQFGGLVNLVDGQFGGLVNFEENCFWGLWRTGSLLF